MYDIGRSKPKQDAPQRSYVAQLAEEMDQRRQEQIARQAEIIERQKKTILNLASDVQALEAHGGPPRPLPVIIREANER